MPADTPLISITEAHGNVINIVYNNREEDAIIRSNFLNDNEVVNEIHFVIERNNARIPQGTPRGPILMGISNNNFQLEFINQINDIYYQLDNIIVNYIKKMKRIIIKLLLQLEVIL